MLLLHEFSGVHTELRSGLREIGIEALTANFGDHFRRFPTDITLGNTANTAWGSLSRATRQLELVGRFQNFDIVQSITASVFNPIVSWFLEAAVLRNPRQAFVYLAASGDTVYRRHVRALPYAPKLDWYERPAQAARENRVFDAASAIVAGAWDYAFAFRREGYTPGFIPFPVMTRRIQFREIGQRKKLRVLHPLNRAAGDDYKGTSFIKAAFARLQEKFRGDVEFIAAGGLPFAEYMELANSCDVLVDQAFTMSYGMSAIYALAQGKAVLSGRESVTEEFACYRQSPVINIAPDISDIADKLEALLSDRVRLQEVGAASRRHAEHYHDAIVVAEQYRQIYAGALDNRWTKP